MAEVVGSFMGRPIISRHKRLAFARPAAQAIARVATDIPLNIAQMSLFEIIYYFMVGINIDAGHFFTQWFILILITLCLTSFFRMVGAWSRHFGLASQISGWFMMALMVYAGESTRVTTTLTSLTDGYRIPHPVPENASVVQMDQLY